MADLPSSTFRINDTTITDMIKQYNVQVICPFYFSKGGRYKIMYVQGADVGISMYPD